MRIVMKYHNNYLASPFIMLLLLLFVSSSAIASDAKQDTEIRTSIKIVGGYEAQPGAWPWMVGLVYHGTPTVYDGQFCGGTLISSKWVLTAAHCVEGKSTSEFYALSGVHNLSADAGTQLGVKQIIQHPDYNSSTDNYDFALLELTTNAPQTPVGIYSGSPSAGISSTLTGETATVIGWGNTSPDGYNYPERLQQVALPVVSNTTCDASYPGDITTNMLCAGYSYGGKDSCQGDSGGPLVLFIAGQWVHSGVVSWGYGCAQPGYYGVYARTTEAIDFIKEYVPDVSLYPESKTLPFLNFILLNGPSTN
jgi:secreted trypsin-like serine protease